MDKLYLDTGALVKLYIIEQGSEFVQKTAQSAKILPIHSLQITELRNALHAAQGRDIISRKTLIKSLNNFDEDLESGVFQQEQPNWDFLWKRSEQLINKFTAKFLCRTLDILHVAAAEDCNADAVLTGYHRQSQLCKVIGLQVIIINLSKLP